MIPIKINGNLPLWSPVICPPHQRQKKTFSWFTNSNVGIERCKQTARPLPKPPDSINSRIFGKIRTLKAGCSTGTLRTDKHNSYNLDDGKMLKRPWRWIGMSQNTDHTWWSSSCKWQKAGYTKQICQFFPFFFFFGRNTILKNTPWNTCCFSPFKIKNKKWIIWWNSLLREVMGKLILGHTLLSLYHCNVDSSGPPYGQLILLFQFTEHLSTKYTKVISYSGKSQWNIPVIWLPNK